MKRMIFSILIIVSLSITANAKYSGGTGESPDPYQIATPQDLNDIGNHPDDFNKSFIMTNDIDMTSIAANEYRIIGSEANNFTGVFDGANHVISNFKCSAGVYAGLFGYTYGDNLKIQNLGLVDVNVQGAAAGALVRDFSGMNTGTISNCYVKGGIVTGNSAGGLIHEGYSGKLLNCYTTCDVRSTEYAAAGIVAFWSGVSISYCHSSGTITGAGANCGGIVGENWGGYIYRCYSIGDIYSNGFNTGGIVGYHTDGIIEQCCSTGNVTDTGSGGGTGGIAGCSDAWMGDANISQCYARGNVTGQDSTGGLVGINSAFGADARIEQCYSSGYVNGDGGMAGGLIGQTTQDYGTPYCISSFWDVNTSGQSTSAGGTGKATAQMKTQSTYTGWDFAGTWRIYESVDYPKFLWTKGHPFGLSFVNFEDIKILSDWWLRDDCDFNNACDDADIDFSGGVDFIDFALIAQNWLQGI